ncbi:MAG: MFS transporter [Candidatus Aenigmatarchaeota archaeon]
MEFRRPKFGNFSYLLISSLITALMGGIFGPFYVLYVQKIGGLENFGFAFGIFTIASSLTSYVVGRYSDRIGRKPFMIFSSFVGAVLMLAYTFITSVAQLFVIQLFFGINDAIWSISEKTFLGDITKKKSRGRTMGKYDLAIGLMQGIAMLFGGILVNRMGFEIIFYLMAAANVVSTIPLFFIKER